MSKDDDARVLKELLKRYRPIVGTIPFAELMERVSDTIIAQAMYDCNNRIDIAADFILRRRSRISSIVNRLEREGKMLEPDKNPYNLLIKEATKWVGTTETGANNGAAVNMFQDYVGPNLHGAPYCCCFVVYCVGQVDAYFKSSNAKYKGTSLRKTPSVMQLWNTAPASKKFDKPFIGAIVIWQKLLRDGKETIQGHTGICIKIDGDIITTIEANTSSPKGLDREGDGIYIKEHNIKNPIGFRLKGYLAAW